MASNSYKSRFKRAIDAGGRRDYREAVALLSRIASETDSMPEAWLYLGRARHAIGEFDKAILAFDAYIEARQDDPSGWFFIGRSCLALGRSREAMAHLGAAIAKGRADAEAWALLGFAELRCKRSAKAVESLEKAVGLAPGDGRIYRAYLNALYVHGIRLLRRGDAAGAAGALRFVIENGLDGAAQRLYASRALRLSGRAGEAIEALEAAIRFAPEDVGLRLRMASLLASSGDVRTAMAIMEKYGDKRSDGTAVPWTESAIDRYRALSAFKAGDYKAALAAATDRIKAGEGDASLRAIAAQANLALGRPARAVEHFKRAIEADPASPALRLGLSHAFLEARDFDGAKAAAKAAAARGAAPSETRYVETICAVEAGAAPEALLQPLVALLKAHPADPRLMMAYAECLYKTGAPELAGPWLDEVLHLCPSHETAMLYAISTAESLENRDEARERYAAYLKAYPDNSRVRRDSVRSLVLAKAWEEASTVIEEGRGLGQLSGSERLLAVCYRNSRRFEDAGALYRRELRNRPKDVDALLGLAFCLAKSGSAAVAAELLEKGSSFIGARSEPFLALGALRVKLGDSEKAAAALLRASELAPADPRPLRHLARLYAKSGVSDIAAKFDEKARALESSTKKAKKREKG